MKQKILGQFYTNKNIFKFKPFLKWFKSIPINEKTKILEPFAGKNGLIEMLKELGLVITYNSFDIEPQHPDVNYNDSINNFPKDFNLCITNPPFLAKNMATRKKIPIVIEPFSDIYEKCLDLCLRNCLYVAAIVPESFIVSPFFKGRLYAVISLIDKALFEETEHPVCLALFNPTITNDYLIYKNEKLIGLYYEKFNSSMNWLGTTQFSQIKFHEPKGNIGLINIDATDNNKNISFCNGELILEKDVGFHSRLRTRINVVTPKNKPLTEKQLFDFISICNKILNKYRKDSVDIFLTSFKGLKNNGNYRRRLDYYTARLIVNKAYATYFKIKEK